MKIIIMILLTTLIACQPSTQNKSSESKDLVGYTIYGNEARRFSSIREGEHLFVYDHEEKDIAYTLVDPDKAYSFMEAIKEGDKYMYVFLNGVTKEYEMK